MKRFLLLTSILVVCLIAGCGGGVKTYDLTVDSSAGGSVTLPGEGTFPCDTSQVVDLVADPDIYFRFDNWTGDVSAVDNVNTASTTITMSDDYSITANFSQLPTYIDEEETITVSVNQEFVIALDSNPTTGYDWEESYDESMLSLVEDKYEPDEKAAGLFGAGGTQYFQFKALKVGETEVTLVYKRPWEEPSPQDVTKVFTVSIR